MTGALFYAPTYPHRHPAQGRVAKVSGCRPPNVGAAGGALRAPSLPPPRSQPPAHSALSTCSRDAFSDPLARSGRFQGWPLSL